MSWAAKGGRFLIYGIGAGTAVWTAKTVRDKTVANKLGTDDLPDYAQTPGSFRSSVPLGKVLASWTTNFEPTVKWDYNWDRRDPKSMVKPPKEDASEKQQNDYKNELEKKTPRANRHLLFIRHGQYIMADVDPERILTALGREQAEFTGLRLKDLKLPYTKMVNSTMTRARETADIIAPHLPEDIPRESCDLLREGAPIPPEPPIGNWRPNVNEFYEEGARIEAAFRKHVHRASPSQKDDSYEVFVCHGNVIRYFMCRALQFPPEAWLRMSLYNSSITYLVVRPSGRVHIKCLGDGGHIPADKLTTT